MNRKNGDVPQEARAERTTHSHSTESRQGIARPQAGTSVAEGGWQAQEIVFAARAGGHRHRSPDMKDRTRTAPKSAPAYTSQDRHFRRGAPFFLPAEPVEDYLARFRPRN